MKRLFAIGLVVLMLNLLIGCTSEVGTYIPHPDFRTEYSEEEHIRRLKERTELIFSEEIESGVLVSYEVELLHAFYDDDPEYFLVELECAEENILGWYGSNVHPILYATKYQHVIGFIISDEYYVKRKNPREAFMNGRSSYTLCAYPDNKKYCGGAGTIQGVEVEGQIILTGTRDCMRVYEGTYEFHTHSEGEECPVGEVIPASLYKSFMNFGNLQAGAPKYKYEKRV